MKNGLTNSTGFSSGMPGINASGAMTGTTLPSTVIMRVALEYITAFLLNRLLLGFNLLSLGGRVRGGIGTSLNVPYFVYLAIVRVLPGHLSQSKGSTEKCSNQSYYFKA